MGQGGGGGGGGERGYSLQDKFMYREFCHLLVFAKGSSRCHKITIQIHELMIIGISAKLSVHFVYFVGMKQCNAICTCLKLSC